MQRWLAQCALSACHACQTVRQENLLGKLGTSEGTCTLKKNKRVAPYHTDYLEGPKAGLSCLRAWGPARGQELRARVREFLARGQERPAPGRESQHPGGEFLPPGRVPGPEAGTPGFRAL